jgi:hypothetical protein
MVGTLRRTSWIRRRSSSGRRCGHRRSRRLGTIARCVAGGAHKGEELGYEGAYHRKAIT